MEGHHIVNRIGNVGVELPTKVETSTVRAVGAIRPGDTLNPLCSVDAVDAIYPVGTIRSVGACGALCSCWTLWSDIAFESLRTLRPDGSGESLDSLWTLGSHRSGKTLRPCWTGCALLRQHNPRACVRVRG